MAYSLIREYNYLVDCLFNSGDFVFVSHLHTMIFCSVVQSDRRFNQTKQTSSIVTTRCDRVYSLNGLNNDIL
jgi:hypothetical protein